MYFETENLSPLANSTTLDALFAGDDEGSQSSTSLIYHAPKQPRGDKTETSTESSSPLSDSSVIIAKVVHTWELDGKTYKLTGKRGIAIIGSISQGKYELILYKEQRNVLIRVSVDDKLQITLQEGNFIKFLYALDKVKTQFLVKFDKDEDCTEMAQEFRKLGVKITDIANKEEAKPKNVPETVQSKEKADILNRLTKIGQSVFPMKQNKDEPEEIVNLAPALSSNENKMVVATNPPIPIPRRVNHDQILPKYEMYDVLSSENRTHNTEIRINLTLINEKLNQILSKINVDQSSNGNNETEALKSRLKVLNLRMENLTKELAEKQPNSSRELDLEATISRLKVELNTSTINAESCIEKLEEKISTDTELIKQLNDTVELQKNSIGDLSAKLEEQSQKDASTSELQQLNDKIIKLEEQLNQKTNLDKEQTTNILKGSMNLMFEQILTVLDQSNSNIPELASIIKKTTYNLVQQITEDN